MRMLAVAIEEAGARVEVGPLPTVLGDADQLEQVFQNLIGNGVKFHGAEPPVVEVAAARHGARWRFTIRDNGIGIDPQFHERIFVIFQRLNSRTKYEGTGIGLAMVQKVLRRHGAEVNVESAPGQGTCFSFELPAAD